MKPVEISFGATRTQIIDLCKGKKVNPSPLDIRDPMRQVHGAPGQVVNKQSCRSGAGVWHKVPPKRDVGGNGRAATPQSSSAHGASGSRSD